CVWPSEERPRTLTQPKLRRSKHTTVAARRRLRSRDLFVEPAEEGEVHVEAREPPTGDGTGNSGVGPVLCAGSRQAISQVRSAAQESSIIASKRVGLMQ